MVETGILHDGFEKPGPGYCFCRSLDSTVLLWVVTYSNANLNLETVMYFGCRDLLDNSLLLGNENK